MTSTYAVVKWEDEGETFSAVSLKKIAIGDRGLDTVIGEKFPIQWNKGQEAATGRIIAIGKKRISLQTYLWNEEHFLQN